MNKLRFLDRPQLIIAITAVASLFISSILYIVSLITANVTYLDNGEIDTLTYNPTLFTIRGIFSLIHFLAVVWFIIRALTYRMRMKEYDLL